MKERITTGLTFMRFLYLAMGITLLIQAIVAKQLAISLLGSYFILMSVLGIGCMGGQCYTPPTKSTSNTNKEIKDVSYEEIK